MEKKIDSVTMEEIAAKLRAELSDIEDCKECGDVDFSLKGIKSQVNETFREEFGHLVDADFKRSLGQRIKLFFWRHINAKYLLAENHLAIWTATEHGGAPGFGSPVEQLAEILEDQNAEIEEMCGYLDAGSFMLKSAGKQLDKLTAEVDRLNDVVKQAVADLERVRSESKVLRTVKANLNQALVNASNDDEPADETEAA